MYAESIASRCIVEMLHENRELHESAVCCHFEQRRAILNSLISLNHQDFGGNRPNDCEDASSKSFSSLSPRSIKGNLRVSGTRSRQKPAGFT